VTYQARKTVANRFGETAGVSDFFDERPLCFPGTPFFPSLLGTNSSFRRTALHEVGGFDHAYAYMLDETDLCLRIVDAGYRIVYEPDALVFHQFAQSHIRSARRVPRSHYPGSVSRTYYVLRHGAPLSEKRAEDVLKNFRDDLMSSHDWFARHGEITPAHRLSLDNDVMFGMRDGRMLAAKVHASGAPKRGELRTDVEPSPFQQLPRASGLRIVLVTRYFPPKHDSGIPRWMKMTAEGMIARGHVVHVITHAEGSPTTHFENGFWVHAIADDGSRSAMELAIKYDVPESIAAWASAVGKEVNRIKSFGVDVISFPIWDLEGLGVLDDPSIGVVMSLMTTYAMAKPFKPDWNARPLYEHFHVNRVIAAEARLLNSVPNIHANSKAIIADLSAAYGVDAGERVHVSFNGTTDPLKQNGWEMRPGPAPGAPVTVSFVGRFEPRKGFDIACAVFARLLEDIEDVHFNLVGDEVSESAIEVMEKTGASALRTDRRVTFRGKVSRQELDELYMESDVVVMPSRYESFGLVAVEAMAAGAPVVALSAGGLSEVVTDGQSGYLIDPGPNEVAEMTKRLRALVTDRNLLLKMRAGARTRYTSTFTVEKMVETVEPLYYRAAKRKMP
jgi:hypothetical protein